MIIVGTEMIPTTGISSFSRIPLGSIYDFKKASQVFKTVIKSGYEPFINHCDLKNEPIADLITKACTDFDNLITSISTIPVCRINLNNGKGVDSWLTMQQLVDAFSNPAEKVTSGMPRFDLDGVDEVINKRSFGVFKTYSDLIDAAVAQQRVSKL